MNHRFDLKVNTFMLNTPNYVTLHADGIIIGCSKLDHLMANVDACEEGPLDPSTYFLPQHSSRLIHSYAGVMQAFDEAWEMDKPNCVDYFD